MLPDLIRRGRHPRVGVTASRATITLRVTAEGRTEQECLDAGIDYVNLWIWNPNVEEWWTDAAWTEYLTMADRLLVERDEAKAKGLFTELVTTPAARYVIQAKGTYKKETFLQDFDDVIISTHPSGVSRWLHVDLVAKAARALR